MSLPFLVPDGAGGGCAGAGGGNGASVVVRAGYCGLAATDVPEMITGHGFGLI